MKKKRFGQLYFILVVAVSLLIPGCTSKDEAKYQEETESINGFVNSFNIEDSSKEDKLDILSQIKENFETYSNNDENKDSKYYEDIVSEYSNQISEMENYFYNIYDSEINENTISSESDKDLNNAINNLNDLLSEIDNDFKIISDDNKFNYYESEINSLIDDYENTIKANEEARIKAEEEEKARQEAEEQARKEAEEKAKQEAQAKSNSSTTTASNNSSSSNESSSDSFSSDNSNSDNSSSSSGMPGPASNIFTSGRAWEGFQWSENDPWMYFDNYGYAYNEDGSYAGYNIYTDEEYSSS